MFRCDPSTDDVALLRRSRRRPSRKPGTRGFGRLRLTVSTDNYRAQALYRRAGYLDVGVPPKRVQGTILIRTGPIEVDDTILTWEKRLDQTA